VKKSLPSVRILFPSVRNLSFPSVRIPFPSVRICAVNPPLEAVDHLRISAFSLAYSDRKSVVTFVNCVQHHSSLVCETDTDEPTQHSATGGSERGEEKSAIEDSGVTSTTGSLKRRKEEGKSIHPMLQKRRLSAPVWYRN
jgi:hypothetical protein